MVGAVSNFTAPPQQIPVSYDVESLAGLEAFAAERRRKFAGQAQGVVRLTGFCLLVRRDVRSERPAVQCRDATAGLRRLPPAGALLLGPAASGTIARRQGLPDAAADACHLLRGVNAVSRDCYHMLFELRERAHGLLFTHELAMDIREFPKFSRS